MKEASSPPKLEGGSVKALTTSSPPKTTTTTKGRRSANHVECASCGKRIGLSFFFFPFFSLFSWNVTCLALSLITTKKTGVKETPMWRKGWVDRIESSTGQEHRVSLCNACGLLWKRGWFCVHCECVYRKDLLEEGKKNKEEVKEEEMWIGCEYCDCLLYTSPSPRDRG